MPAKNINLLIGLLILLIGALSLLLYFFPQITSTLDTLQVTKLVRELKEKNSTKLDIEELAFETPPSSLFKIRGYFTSDLYYAGDYIKGDFVINGDTTKTPVAVFLTHKDGSIQFSLAPDKDTGEVVWTLTPTEEVKKNIKENKQVELRITVSDDQRPGTEQIKSTMRDLMQTGVIDGQKTAFAIDMVGMLEE